MKVVNLEYSEEYVRRYTFRLNCKHLWLRKKYKTVRKTVSGNGIDYETAKKQFLDSVKAPRNYRAVSVSGTVIIG